MNLRVRFILLITGVILIPLLVMGISFSIFNKYVYPSNPQDIVRDFNQSLKELESADQAVVLIDNLEDAYFGLIVENPEQIESDLLNFNPKRPKMIIQSKIHRFKNGSEGLILLGINILDESTGIFILIFLLSIIGALTIFSLLIIRSINSSINILEAATGKIADGNLDFELNTGGSDKLGSLTRSLDKMRHQIKMEYDRRNRFFMGISHDLKTPLASITGYTDALLEGLSENTETTDKYLRIIKKKSHQLEQRITHLIRYIELSNCDFQASLEEKPLAPFLTDFLGRYEEETGFHGHRLRWLVEIPDDLQIPFNEELLGRALENLIQNAFKYGLTGKSVAVSCSINENIVKILVKNIGPAIPADILPYIFEPLFRGDKSRKGDGFGLGLASVKSIIESHGWSISVISNEGITIFKIFIPI